MIDLTRWVEALRSGAILSNETRRKLFWPHARMKGRQVGYYGYGWAINSASDGSCVIGHNGGGGIHYDVVAIFPQHAVVSVAFNTQQKTPWSAGDNFVETLTPVLTGAALPLPETTSALAPAEVAGTYSIPSGERFFRVLREQGRFKVPMDSIAALRLFAPWPPAAPRVTAALGDRAALLSELLAGISAGNYELLLERLPADLPAPAEVQFWRDYWPRSLARLGPFVAAEVIDTVLVDGVPRTIARLRFSRGSTIVAMVHSAGGKLFIDVIPRAYYPETYLAPVGERRFQAYYPTTKRAIRVSANGTELIVGTDEGQVTAQRTSL